MMFDFGKPEDTAELFWQASLNMVGPKLPEVHYSEMSREDLRNAFIYMYSALDRAYDEGADSAVIDYLTENYDEIFVYYAEVDDDFRRAVDKGRHRPLPGRYPETIKKYRQLAGLA